MENKKNECSREFDIIVNIDLSLTEQDRIDILTKTIKETILKDCFHDYSYSDNDANAFIKACISLSNCKLNSPKFNMLIKYFGFVYGYITEVKPNTSINNFFELCSDISDILKTKSNKNSISDSFIEFYQIYKEELYRLENTNTSLSDSE